MHSGYTLPKGCSWKGIQLQSGWLINNVGQPTLPDDLAQTEESVLQ